MLSNISDFSVSVICTIMMIIVLEMIIPEGKSKKYISFVCSIVVTLTLVEPILNLVNIDIGEVFANNEITYEEFKYDDNLYENAMRKSYEENLITDIINRLKENGYRVSNVRVEYDDITLQPLKVYMDLESEMGYVQPVKIEVSKGGNSLEDELMKNKIKNIISENYGVKKENIIVN